jgi:dephospho-CoA kinase
MVFGKPDRLEKLNRLVHPCVEQDYQQWIEMFSDRPYVVKEAALLLESGSAERLDKLVVVTSPVKLRVKRVLQRDPHRTEEDVRNIMESQMPEREKLKRANFTVTNDETILVIPQVLKLHELFSIGH